MQRGRTTPVRTKHGGPMWRVKLGESAVDAVKGIGGLFGGGDEEK